MSVFLVLSYIGMYYAYGNIMANAAIKQWNPYEVSLGTSRLPGRSYFRSIHTCSPLPLIHAPV